MPNMLDLRRRSSFPILLRCGMIQLATAQNCFVKCVVVRVRDDVEGVQLRTQSHSTMGTPHPHAVTVLREKGVDVTSHNKRPDTVSTCLCLLLWRKGFAVQETSQKHRSGARQRARWCSRSTQQILDVRVPFISEQKFQLIT